MTLHPKTVLIFAAGMSLMVAGCSLDQGSAMSSSSAPPPPSAEQDKFAAPVHTAVDKLRALAPPEGLRMTPLFSEKVSGTDERLRRLEEAVQNVRNDMDVVAPAVVRLAVLEHQNGIPTVEHDEAMPDVSGQADVPVAAPEADVVEAPALTPSSPAPAAKEESTPAPASEASTAGDVKGIRIADHKDKTRIVLDMTVKYEDKVRIEGDGKQLIIPLGKLKWLGRPSFDVYSAELISGYRVVDDKLHVDLMYPSKIKTQDVLMPGKGVKGYRTVIDLVSADVHR